MAYPTYEEWFAGLEPDRQAKASQMVAKLKELGASEPESWVRSELSENIAQSMRYLVLSELCKAIHWSDEDIARILMSAREAATEGTGDYSEDAGLALQRLDAAGIGQQELAPLLRLAAYDTLFSLVEVLDAGCAWDQDDMAGWNLIEIDQDNDKPTGRDIGGLHESMLEVMHDQGLKVNP